MNILPFEQEIQQSLSVLKSGGIILYPTDTIWGIGCDATNKEAVEKIYSLKRRTDSKSMILLVDEANRIMDYVKVVPEMAWDLIEYADSPLTIIYPGAMKLAPNVIADDQSVAIRVVRNEFCQRLIRLLRKPLVSTSANISGQNPPAGFKDIAAEIIAGVDYCVNQSIDQNRNLKPSQIIKLEVNGEFRIIRK